MFLTQTLIRTLIVLMVLGTMHLPLARATETSDVTNQINSTDIQKALTESGFYKGSIDGVLGKKTKAAIRKFQEANNLKADGVCGPKTWEKLKAYLEEAQEIDASETDSSTVTSSETDTSSTDPAATPAQIKDDLTAPLVDDSSYEDYGYSEYDNVASEEGSGDLKQKLVS